MVAAGFGMLLYNITIQKPDGQIGITRWPIDFTRDFSGHITFANDAPTVTQTGQQLLRDNRLWLQILDTHGDEIQSVNKPGEIQAHYSASDLLDAYFNGAGRYSVFSGSVRSGDNDWTYLIGFPVPISRITY